MIQWTCTITTSRPPPEHTGAEQCRYTRYARLDNVDTVEIQCVDKVCRHRVDTVDSVVLLFRAGEDTELVVCALFHDVGELLSPVCHGEIGDQCRAATTPLI